jgi:hypothetical protein
MTEVGAKRVRPAPLCRAIRVDARKRAIRELLDQGDRRPQRATETKKGADLLSIQRITQFLGSEGPHDIKNTPWRGEMFDF